MFDSKRGRAGGVHARTFRACVSSVCGSIARHSIPGVLTNPAFSWPVPSHFRLTARYVLVHSQVTSVMPEFSPLLLHGRQMFSKSSDTVLALPVPLEK